MKFIKGTFVVSLFVLVAFNVSMLTAENSNDFGLSFLLRLASANESEVGDGIKNVVCESCECSNGKDGYTLNCKDVVSTGEECSSDPLQKCYRVVVSFPLIWNTTTDICN